MENRFYPKYIQFLKLKEKWFNETKYLSSLTDIYNSKYYKEIIAMGDIAVHYMISDFKRTPDDPPLWFEALRQLTGYSLEVENESVGKIADIAKLWVEWFDNRKTEIDDDILIEIAKSMLSEINPLANCGWIGCRYGDCLADVLNELGAVKVLREQYVKDYQGEVDVDVLLKDGRIFSYYYSYGSCSGCDTWEAKGYDDDEIKREMKMKATYFSSMNEYSQWLKMRERE